MKYLSPTSLFGGILVPPLDKKAIQLGRKKLLAELELAGGDTIAIDGKSYDKNEIIQYFEELLSGNALDYHNTVSTDAVLLGFLQEGRLGPGQQFKRQAIYQDPAFIRWISPYFSQSFEQLIHDAFERSDDLTVSSLLNNPLLMTGMDEDRIWTDIARLIHDEIDLLQRYFASNRRQTAVWHSPKAMPMAAISGVMQYDHVRIISLLPVSRFSGLRDEYAFAMMQASIVTFNRHVRQRDLAETWIINAESLAVSPQLKNQIVDKLEEFRRLRSKKIPVNFRVIFIIIIAINMLRGLSCNEDRSGIFPNAPVIYTIPPKDSNWRKLIDSSRGLQQPDLPGPNPSGQYH